MASAEREPITGVWGWSLSRVQGQSPQQVQGQSEPQQGPGAELPAGPGAEPLVRGSGGVSCDTVAYLVVHHRHSITGMLISSGIQSKQV